MVRKAQRLRSVAETMINAQSINWFQALKIKIRPVEFLLPPISPKKSENMSRIFFVGTFFLRHSEKVTPGLNFADIRKFVQAIGRQFLADQVEFFFNLTGPAGADVPF